MDTPDDRLNDAVARAEQARLVRLASRPKPPLWERHPTLTAGLVALVAALLTGLIGFLGATVGANASIRVATMAADADSLKRAQDKREVAYKDYLNAANDFYYAWEALQFANKPGTDEVLKILSRYETTRAAYQSQINEIYVLGSDKAWVAHEMVARTLPSTVPMTLPPKEREPDKAKFTAAYLDFLRIRCQEATSLPRSGCSPK